MPGILQVVHGKKICLEKIATFFFRGAHQKKTDPKLFKKKNQAPVTFWKMCNFAFEGGALRGTTSATWTHWFNALDLGQVSSNFLGAIGPWFSEKNDFPVESKRHLTPELWGFAGQCRSGELEIFHERIAAIHPAT